MTNVGAWNCKFCVIDAIKSIDKHSCVRLIVKSTESAESTSSYYIEKVQT